MSTSPRTIQHVTRLVAHNKLTLTDAVDSSLSAIEQWEPQINAMREVLADSAHHEAAAFMNDSSYLKKRLAGVTIAIKDLISTVQGHTAAASQMLKNYRAPFAATVVERLVAEGAIIIGKANQDEFAMGSSNEYSAFGPTKNPWDITRVPGGSSGGSAAAVATGEATCALGTDTGGSIRLPASFCSVVGLKPTYGRLSRFGVIAYASSFDQVGPIGRTVSDVATLTGIMAGSDPFDATSSNEPVPDYEAACGKNIAGLTIGVPKEYFGAAVDPAVAAAIQTALHDLEAQGARLKEISFTLLDAAIPTYYLLVKSEAASNLARYDGLRYAPSDQTSEDLLGHYEAVRGSSFGPEVKRSILMGTYALSAGYVDAWYKKASRVRTLIQREFQEIFNSVDVIAGPVSPEIAFKIGSKSDDPLKMYLADLLTVPASIAGLPALSVPAGFVHDLPVGLQLIGPAFQEERLFQVGAAYEKNHDWHNKVPKLTE